MRVSVITDLSLLYDLRNEIKASIADIGAANNYESAVALWKDAYQNIRELHRKSILSDFSFAMYAQMLDEAITE